MLASMEKDTKTVADLADPTVVRAEMRRAIGAITGKSKLEILWLLNQRTHRFGKLRSIPGITQHILTTQLRELEADGYERFSRRCRLGWSIPSHRPLEP